MGTRDLSIARLAFYAYAAFIGLLVVAIHSLAATSWHIGDWIAIYILMFLIMSIVFIPGSLLISILNPFINGKVGILVATLVTLGILNALARGLVHGRPLLFTMVGITILLSLWLKKQTSRELI